MSDRLLPTLTKEVVKLHKGGGNKTPSPQITLLLMIGEY